MKIGILFKIYKKKEKVESGKGKCGRIIKIIREIELQDLNRKKERPTKAISNSHKEGEERGIFKSEEEYHSDTHSNINQRPNKKRKAKNFQKNDDEGSE